MFNLLITASAPLGIAAPVLISTHLISDLETIFDDVVFLKDGEIVLHQSTEDLRLERKQSIDEAFREVFRC